MKNESTRVAKLLTCQRHMFSLPKGLHYLNCASQSPLPNTVAQAAHEAIARKVNPSLASDAESFAPVEALREIVGRVVNASAERVALIPSVSYGVAVALANITIAAGQNVVAPAEEFPSNVYGWMDACREHGAELRLVPRPTDTQQPGKEWNERILEAIDKNTAVVALTPLHWTDGTWFDLPAVSERAREVGAAFLVDATQTVGAVPLDVAAFRPDFLICTGYKWCLGPKGAGFLVVGDRFMDGRPIEKTWIGREGSEDFGRLVNYSEHYRGGARRFDAGEHHNPITVSMLSAGLQQVLAWGPDNIQSYCVGLAEQAEAALAETEYALAPAGERASHLFGIHVAEVARLPAIVAALKARNVYVSPRGSAIRVSPHLYNTPED
ncbi:MAG: aminotransferase class V-fold PLP-dependent enzyme, partial [SAR324 cluster bacterium]|nr:aminotransferase class V-fold PLP-dependent enzyme [SAR324 cluster bacterium]